MNMNLNTWYHITVTWDKTDGPARFYRNGSIIQSLGSKTIDISGNTKELNVGADYGNPPISNTPDDNFKGILDEIRMSKVQRSASWIKASYYSETNNLLNIGTQETIIKKPLFISESPSNGTKGVDINPLLSIHISDLQGNPVQWWIKTNATGSWTDLNTGILPTGDNTVSASTTTMTNYNTEYYWRVQAVDTITHNWTNATYRFTTKATWWSNDWAYRKVHDIIGTTSGSQQDYQVKIVVNYDAGTDTGENVYVNGNTIH
jgi:hypothetical protein